MPTKPSFYNFSSNLTRGRFFCQVFENKPAPNPRCQVGCSFDISPSDDRQNILYNSIAKSGQMLYTLSEILRKEVAQMFYMLKGSVAYHNYACAHLARPLN